MGLPFGFRTENIASTSLITSLKDEGTSEGSLAVSGTISVGSILTFTISFPLPVSQVVNIDRVKVSGTAYTNANDKWFPHSGATDIRSDGASKPYLISIATTYSSGNVNFVYNFINNTGGSVGLSGITVYAHARFVSAPW